MKLFLALQNSESNKVLANKEVELIKITTESGKELLVTPEHKVAIKTLFNKLKYISAEAIMPWHNVVTLDNS